MFLLNIIIYYFVEKMSMQYTYTSHIFYVKNKLTQM